MFFGGQVVKYCRYIIIFFHFYFILYGAKGLDRRGYTSKFETRIFQAEVFDLTSTIYAQIMATSRLYIVFITV